MKDYLQTWQLFLLLTNAMLGVIIFEMAWSKTYVHRTLPNKLPELHNKMAVFRRLDAEKWRKWQFYPGALTLLLPRLLLLGIFGVLLLLMLGISLICYDKTKPMSGCRKWIVRGIYVFWAHTISSLAFWTCARYKYISEE